MTTVLRDPASHKGENGTVVICGGSVHMHGAPLLSALAAEATGVDLLYVSLPRCHADVARHTGLNFQVHPWRGDTLTMHDVDAVLERMATVDCAVVGPGLDREPGSLDMLRTLIESATCPLVLDATALQPWTGQVIRQRQCVVTPHLGELERMGVTEDAVAAVAREWQTVIHLKGTVDRTYDADGTCRETSGGNAGLTVGGTGDVLAGAIAGLRAQRVPAAAACSMASTLVKRAGSELYVTHGYAYTALDVIRCLPRLLRELTLTP